MFFCRIYDDKLAQAAYLIGCQQTGEAIVIDPQRDVDRYYQHAAREGLHLSACTETHIHADFLSGCRELAERDVKVYLSDEGGEDWKYSWISGTRQTRTGNYNFQLLRHGDRFSVGFVEFEVVHTPGHTPEHICFLVTDRGGQTDSAAPRAPMGVATGDFVFVGDLGRPDLLESAAGRAGASEPAARQLYQSVLAFEQLPDYVQVWPGHGAGSACGKALGAVPQSTVGYERRFNPSIIAADNGEAFFVRSVLDGQPEPPLYFARMKRDNRSGPKVLGDLPRPQALDADALLALDGRVITLIDTRPWKAFKAGHIPGSLYHPLNQSFTTDAGSMVSEDEEIILIVPGAQLDEAVRALVRIGLDRITGWCDPLLLDEYQRLGGRLAPTSEVSAHDARGLLELPGVWLLDVRRRSEFGEGHMPGAHNITHTLLAANLESVPKDQHILVNCRSGGRSARACALLQKHGFRVSNLAGGILAWQAEAGARLDR